MSKWLLLYFLNSAWMIPVLALCTIALVRLMSAADTLSRHRLWVACLVLSTILPAASSCRMLILANRPHLPGLSLEKITSATNRQMDQTRQMPLHLRQISPPPSDSGLGRSLISLYVFSFMFGGVRLVQAIRKTRNMVKASTEIELTPYLHGELRRAAQAMGIARIKVYGNANLNCPAMVVWPKPMLLVPESFAELLPEDAMAAVYHEFAHIRRTDFHLNFVYEMIAILVFYHPVLHWIKREIDVSREVVCDELAAAATTGRVGYARSLFRLAKMAHGGHATYDLSLGVMQTNALEDRISTLLHYPSSVTARRAKISGAACIITFAAVSAGLTMTGLHSAAAQIPKDRAQLANLAGSRDTLISPARKQDVQLEASETECDGKDHRADHPHPSQRHNNCGKASRASCTNECPEKKFPQSLPTLKSFAKT